MRNIYDKTYFNDVLLNFGEMFTLLSKSKITLNDAQEQVFEYIKNEVWGSLQPLSVNKKNEGLASTTKQAYKFYCSAENRIYIDDIIITQSGVWLLVTSYIPWDYHGVRELQCEAISLEQVRNLKEISRFTKKIAGDENDLKHSTNTLKHIENIENILSVNELKKIKAHLDDVITKREENERI